MGFKRQFSSQFFPVETENIENGERSKDVGLGVGYRFDILNDVSHERVVNDGDSSGGVGEGADEVGDGAAEMEG